MTTVVYADGEIASDTLACWGSNRDGHMTKIARRGSVLAGVSGAANACKAFLDWFNGGLKGDPPQMPEGERTSFGLIVTPDDWVLLYGPHGWEMTRNPNVCMGSGAEFAQGALAMGADARRAVEVAMIYDTKTGGEITVLRR